MKQRELGTIIIFCGKHRLTKEALGKCGKDMYTVQCTGNTGAIAGANQRRHHTRWSHGTARVCALIHAKVIHLACIA
jgi:hypothetical protein